MTGGASDAGWTASLGVLTIDGLGPVDVDDHTEREWIDLGSVGPRIDAVASLCGQSRTWRTEATPSPAAKAT